MKKFFLLAIATVLGVFGASSNAMAGDDRIINASQLPQTARQFISKYFPNEKIAYVKLETGFFDKEYEVVFSSASKVEFDSNGQWKEVDCKYSQVPADVIAPQVKTHVQNTYPGVYIVQVSKDRYDYEVKLTNGLELTFDNKYNLIDIDD